MQLSLCSSCGNIIEGRIKFCTGCGLVVTAHSVTTIQEPAPINPIQKIEDDINPIILEKALVRRNYMRQLADTNGHENAEDSQFIFDPVVPSSPPPQPAIARTTRLDSTLRETAAQAQKAAEEEQSTNLQEEPVLEANIQDTPPLPLVPQITPPSVPPQVQTSPPPPTPQTQEFLPPPQPQVPTPVNPPSPLTSQVNQIPTQISTQLPPTPSVSQDLAPANEQMPTATTQAFPSGNSSPSNQSMFSNSFNASSFRARIPFVDDDYPSEDSTVAPENVSSTAESAIELDTEPAQSLEIQTNFVPDTSPNHTNASSSLPNNEGSEAPHQNEPLLSQSHPEPFPESFTTEPNQQQPEATVQSSTANPFLSANLSRNSRMPNDFFIESMPEAESSEESFAPNAQTNTAPELQANTQVEAQEQVAKARFVQSADFFSADPQPPVYQSPNQHGISSGYNSPQAETASQAAENQSQSSNSPSRPSNTQDDFFNAGPPQENIRQNIQNKQLSEEDRNTQAKAENYESYAPINDSSATTNKKEPEKETEEQEEEDNKKPKFKSRFNKDKDDLESSSDKTTDSDNPIKKFLDDLESEVQIGATTLTKKNAIIGGIVVGIVILQLIGFAFKSIGGAIGGATAGLNIGQSSQMNLTGRWQYYYGFNGQTFSGLMDINQNGNTILGQGQGQPPDTKPFVIDGKIVNGNTVVFKKAYLDATGHPAGKPVDYQGAISYQPNLPMAMGGQYTMKYSTGFGVGRKSFVATNNWKAQMLQAGAANQAPVQNPVPTGIPPLQGQSQPVAGGHSGGNLNPGNLHELFLKVALGLVIFCVLLVIASLKLFGPSGLLNIWTKKEYIPSQFKSQHNKILAELGKGIKPGGMPFGDRLEWGIHQFWMPQKLALSPSLRETNPHVLVLGAGSKGKTRLLANMISHDIESDDRAVVVIDSDGGLIDLLINWIAAHPKGKDISDRLIIVDPTYKQGCPAYNPLEAPDDGDLQAAASSIVFGFKAIYTEPPGSQSQWNQQTANILRNSALLLMANGKTLTDLPTLLSDNDFRDVLLERIEQVKHERAEFITLLETWGQYKRLARTDQWITWVEPILNRVTPMLSDPRIRPILTKPKGDLNLKELISDGKILLVKIPQGQLDENGNLLGSLLVTGLKQAALSLTNSNTRKHPCALYMDEIDAFIEKETFDAISSETRKFQIGFVGASKTLQHLPDDFRNQLIINVGTICCFALAKKDGDLLGPQMFRVDGRKIKHRTMQNIFNPVNTSPQFELISDEEKLNIDRVVGQEERTFFCYRVGTVAGVFHLKSTEFKDIPEKSINWSLVEELHRW